MLKEEEKDQASGGRPKTFSRSISWAERPQRKINSKPHWNSKARACLPPLQPLSITRPSVEEWPKAGSDDIGVWCSNPPTPGTRSGSVTPREYSTSDQLPPRKFEFMKDKLAFFEKECSRVSDHIYLGSNAIAKDRETLRQNGITHVLNCVGFVCPEYFKNELVYKTLWLQDRPSEDITSILYDVFDYFEDVREQKGRVLVHCCQGVSRSTSLVIAYLMWKEGRSFDDAFQHVKAARGVSNPNVGFACQLLQCQKRVHALPPSPTSVFRMYRMAPHSPYDPLHLVPKMLNESDLDKLDSRGAFIVHVPSALFVWIGEHCAPLMSESATSAASQILRYERAQCPVFTVKEGEEPFKFWDSFSYRKSFEEGFRVKKPDVEVTAGDRRCHEYDLDFEMFHRAVAGGVVPPFAVSDMGPETRLPARENGWNKLRRKFGNGTVKEIITSKPLVDSFSSFLVSKLKSSSSFSPSTSPSTSDYSSSFTFSPASSNWSDLSFASAQPSPCEPESRDTDSYKSNPREESDNSCLLDNATSPLRQETECSSESKTNLYSIDESSQLSENSRFLEDDDAMKNVGFNSNSEVSSKESIDESSQISDVNNFSAIDDDEEVSSRSQDGKSHDKLRIDQKI